MTERERERERERDLNTTLEDARQDWFSKFTICVVDVSATFGLEMTVKPVRMLRTQTKTHTHTHTLRDVSVWFSSVEFARINVVLTAKHFRTTTQ